MSQWTHIRGGLELISTPYEMKKMPKSLVEPKKEDFETEEPNDSFVYPQTKQEKIEQRIKSMSNEELERYILEAKARKLMLEEEFN
jgi:hypothetical protein